LRDTVPEPFTTRETVAVETPASLAMSVSVHDRTFRPASASFFISLDRRSPSRLECEALIEDGVISRRCLRRQPQALEIQPGAKQHIARWQSGRRLPKSSILQIGIHAVEIDAIEYVEEIDTEFKVDALSNLGDFL
jgi:hypothetical protein